MFEPGTDQLQVALEQRVAILTLNRPAARNALSPELSIALREAIAWAADAPEVGCVVVTGAGKAFCAGGDVKAMAQAKQPNAPKPSVEVRFAELAQRHHGIGGALRAMSKPTIAALPGPAAGAGMAIALCCDLRIAASDAFLSTGYARIGLPGDYGIAWLLSRIVSPGLARQLMLTSERIGAEDALAKGLVNAVVAPEALAQTTAELARSFANGPQVAYRYIKQNLDEALQIDHATAIEREADRLIKASGTEDHKEAVTAFAEKRLPRFRSR